ncbi:MAG: EAL domain-containing protein [Pseudomonadales bacterium]|nr:EAL domain-containing protein [Pseudomonadales bacterium]MCP5183960.1 EAL domain-containing protein [Pseudomonadales bacterium]
MADLLAGITKGRPRSLVNEILRTQMLFAAVVGLFALGGLWATSNYVMRHNLENSAARWIAELAPLGKGLYEKDPDANLLAVRTYLDRYKELLYVRYYGADGEPLYVETGDTNTVFPSLAMRKIRRLEKLASTDHPQLLDDRDAPHIRLSQAIVRDSLEGADLFTAEKLADVSGQRVIAGFVEIGLDVAGYDADLTRSMLIVSAIVLATFFGLGAVGRLIVAHGLAPLRQLEGPLKRLAAGELDIDVPPSPHQEIASIGEALKSAAESIRERDQHLRRLASYDQLTGLANRRYFLERVEHLFAVQHGAVLFIDLDQFKYVNDTLGHRGGDQILAQAAERLRQTVRPGDLIARVGGDEFVMFVAGVDARRAEAIGNQILSDLREYPLTQDGHVFNIGCSVGIAMVERNNAFTPAEIVSHADLACRQAKNDGRNRAHLFLHTDTDIAAIQNDLHRQQQIKLALKNDGFELHYQPLLDMKTGRVDHFEALLRMRGSDGLIFPDTFLPAAQRFGLMADIDRWVIRQAIVELAALRRTRPEVKFGINLTGSTFVEGDFGTFVLALLDEHQVPAANIIFEITEQVAIGSFSDAVPQIRALVERGCEFAVDDFGTGYSSLSYLKRLPVQYIKIDGVFIRRLVDSEVDQAIVRAVVDIARIMGRKTVAEFVGDEATFNLIRDLGIDYAQGFHVGKPARNIPAHPQDNIIPLPAPRSA